MVIVWDYEERSVKGSHEIHKVRVEDVCFSRDSNYLISLGGRDDGNIVIWDVIKNEAMCGAFASNEIAGNAFIISRTNNRDKCFVTAGDNTFKVWRIDPASRKVHGVNVKVGKLRRSINCIAIDERDENAYCGTSSGDIIRARLNYHRDLAHTEPVRNPIMIGCYSKIPKDLKKMKAGEGELYAGGVRVVLLLKDGRIIVGAGDGTVDLVEIIENDINVTNKSVKLPNAPRIQSYLTENVTGSITSIELLGTQFILVGTSRCEIYQLKLSNFDMRLLVTCHTSAIYDIAFPHNYSEVFATGSTNDIRLWCLETQKELLRIAVPNFVCSSLCFSYDGKMIISAWNDGIIRAFAAQTGILVFLIHNAHIKAVSAVGITKDGKKIISGGCDGQVRIWDIRPNVQRLSAVLKEHRGAVTSLHISQNDENAISSSTDGTCIIWDLTLATRKKVLMGNTMYMSSRFSPNGVQILTCGTDRKIAFWETLDGLMVREIEGSTAGSLNCLDIGPDGQHFVTGSNDCIVKLWDYDSAETTHIGMGHAAIITACKFSPDGRCIVTVSADGAIMIWECPFISQFEETRIDKCSDSVATQSTCSIREEAWN
ncbi:cilia- and flagella-associated protein 52 isoform X2 [Cephus cinctus]|nr:cilia- and flagella-associated protein 52 isoform X2 [Cephus cinctus]